MKKNNNDSQKITHYMPCIISYSASSTVNIGNYESRKISFGISVPISNYSKIKVVRDKIVDFVDRFVEEKMKEIRTQANGSSDAEVIDLENEPF